MFGIAEILSNVEAAGGQEYSEQTSMVFSRGENGSSAVGLFSGVVWLDFFSGFCLAQGCDDNFFLVLVRKRISKHPEQFGTGMIEGVASPETANNASTAGSMIPLLALGFRRALPRQCFWEHSSSKESSLAFVHL